MYSEELIKIDKENKSCTAFGMEVNERKTKVMVIEKQPRTELTIMSSGTALEEVNKYKYLGTLTTADTRCIQKIRRRIGTAEKPF